MRSAATATFLTPAQGNAAYLQLIGGSLSGPLAVTGQVSSGGAAGEFLFYDRANQANSFGWLANTGTAFLNYNGSVNVFTVGSTGNVSANGNITLGGTIGPAPYLGVNTNSNAAAGQVGEVIQSTLLYASRVAISSATFTNILSIALTAGDWDVYGNLVCTDSCRGPSGGSELRAAFSATAPIGG